jgi:hypothetical protein
MILRALKQTSKKSFVHDITHIFNTLFMFATWWYINELLIARSNDFLKQARASKKT